MQKKCLTLKTKKAVESFQLYLEQKMFYWCEETFIYKEKNYRKVKGHFILQIKTCSLRYSVSKEIPIIMQNSSKYDFLLTMKNLADDFDSTDSECLKKKTERFIS